LSLIIVLRRQTAIRDCRGTMYRSALINRIQFKAN
jgi:hypothetical protein